MNIWYFCMDSHIDSGAGLYAPSIHILETIEALREQGHDVRSFFAGDHPQTASHAFGRAYGTLTKRHRLFAWSKALLRDLYELHQNMLERHTIEPIFRTQGIDLVYERLAQNKISVSACTRKYGIPLIVESNAPAEERKQYWGSPLHRITQGLEKTVLERADAVIVVSTPLKRHYQRLGIPPERIFVLPNGVNETLFSPEHVSRDVRSELNLEHKVVIGFVGNIHKYHGIELLLPLARMLNAPERNIHFLIMGGDTASEAWRSSLASEDMQGVFTFIDPVRHTEVPQYIAAMDICVLPQFMWYGSPMKILEYGAMGKAIVAPDLENIRDVLTHGKTALLFEPGSLSTLFQALDELVGNERLRSQLGSAARNHVLANHTWARNAERIGLIFSQITSGFASPGFTCAQDNCA